MFKKTNIKTKLMALIGVLSLIIAGVAAGGIYALSRVSENYSHVADVNLGNAVNLGVMQGLQKDIVIRIERIVGSDPNAEILGQVVKNTEGDIQQYEAASRTYEEIPFVEGEEALWNEVVKEWKPFVEMTWKLIEMSKSSRPEDKQARIQLSGTRYTDLQRSYRQRINTLIEFQGKESVKWAGRAKTTAQAARIALVAASGAVLVVALLLGFFLSSNLSKTLARLTERISQAADQTGSASQQLSSASQQVSAGSTEAASSLEETVSSVEELTSMVKLNSDNAKQAASLSRSSTETALRGETEIQKLIESMGEIAQASKKIEEIINVIDDIAFQTNLLALNAAVEAARAGEQGKGFAVVAEAVRNLAQRSASAAKDISSLIKDSVGKTEQGVHTADSSKSVLSEILTSVKKVSDLNAEIAQASSEQSNGLEQIGKAINELDRSVQQNASASEEVAASSEELCSQAQLLQEVVVELTELVDGVKSPHSQGKLASVAPIRGGVKDSQAQAA